MTTHCPQDMFSRSLRIRAENVLGTSHNYLPGPLLNVRLGRLQDAILRRRSFKNVNSFLIDCKS